VWEHREEIDAGIIWGVPVRLDRWCLELLGEAGLLRHPVSEDTWYTVKKWRCEGPFGIGAARLRFKTNRLAVGTSFMLSGGASLNPGWLSSFASDYASGPLRFRSRLFCSSPFFRNAEGETLDVPLGGSFDFRYRPPEGIQISAEYEGGLANDYEDAAGAALGWRFGEIQVSVETDWNRLFYDSVSDSDLSACRRLKTRFVWDRGYYHIGILGALEPDHGWSLKLENSIPIHSSRQIDFYLLLHQENGPLLYDFKIKGRWDIGKNSIIVSVFTGDLLRDWKNGPSSSGDFLAELRWVRKLAE
jgi:hypothetical protein